MVADRQDPDAEALKLQQALAAAEELRSTLGEAAGAVLSAVRQRLQELQPGLAGQPRAAEADRRLCTVVFADVSGFTAMSTKQDPEVVRAFQNDFFPEMSRCVEQFGGFVEKFVGDALLAAFGAPVAHEDDPERALRAALAMRARMERINDRWAPRLGHRLKLHIGVNTGPVVAGEIGSGGAYAVTGDTTNTASRLQNLAQGGQVIVGPETYRLASHAFDFRAIDPVLLKGKPDALQVYELAGLRADRTPRRGLQSRGISSPIVGRMEEMASLLACVKDLAAGRGGIITVTGEAGLGKSRLLAEAQKAIGQDVRWIEGRALSYSQSLSYWPFLEIIRKDAGIGDDDPEDLSWGKLAARIGTLLPDQVEEILPYMATLLGLEVKGALAERVRYLDGDAMRRQVFRSTRLYFEAVAREQPLLLVLEDLHWADASSGALAEHLLPLATSAPFLICAVGRPDPGTPATKFSEAARREYPDAVTAIAVKPLTDGDAGQLLQNLVAVDAASSHVRDLILAKAEGNPFFVEEVVRDLTDQGAVRRDEATGRWYVTAQPEDIAIPDTLQGVVMARVDRLDEDVKQVLRTAAVIGRTFFFVVLKSIAEADRALEQRLSELQALELIRERRQTPELEYIFKHAVVQEATYESILLQRRRELHRRVGEAIESAFTGRLNEFNGLLAYHYARAEAWDKAQEYLFKAGDQAGNLAADTEAMGHYQQAMAAYAKAFGSEMAPLERAVMDRKLGEALFRQGNLPESLAYMDRALGHLGSPYPQTKAGVRWAILREVFRQMAHRFALPGRWDPDKRTGPPTPEQEERSYIYHLLGWIDYFHDQERLALDVLRLLNDSESAGVDVGIARGAMGVGIACAAAGLPGAARSYQHRAVAYADRVNQPLAIGQAYLGLGMLEYEHGNYDASIKAMTHSADAYWTAGEIRGWSSALNWVLIIDEQRGDFEQALELSARMARVGEEAGDLQTWAFGVGYGSRSMVAVGKVQEAIALCTAHGDAYKLDTIGYSGNYGWALLKAGRVEDALKILEEGVGYIKLKGLRTGGVVRPRDSLVEAYLTAAERSEGPPRHQFLHKAYAEAKALSSIGKLYREAKMRGSRRLAHCDWVAGRHERARRLWERSLAETRHVKARFEEGKTLLDMGRFSGDAESLKQALVLFQTLGTPMELAQAKDALEKLP
jgi:class 3 adenylate cyclase/tetratricopeptide (TPR) repeat protein